MDGGRFRDLQDDARRGLRELNGALFHQGQEIRIVEGVAGEIDIERAVRVQGMEPHGFGEDTAIQFLDAAELFQCRDEAARRDELVLTGSDADQDLVPGGFDILGDR